MMIYNWQQPDWPNFQYDASTIQETLFSIAGKTGIISGKLAHLAQNLQTEAMINLMVEEAIKTSKIEGEYISRLDVRSSIKNKLGLNTKIIQIQDKRAQGVAELMLDVRNTFQEPLTETKLCDWHLMLLSSSYNPNLKIGCWRSHPEPMQIVSGHHGKSIVHFEAPPSKAVPSEMTRFIQWFNNTGPGGLHEIKLPAVRAAIAHIYFESIHPFEDGNGRIGRAIAEKALSQSLGYPVMISLSQAIEADRKAYYAALKKASQTNVITEWVRYFANIILNAQIETERQIDFILKKTAFYDNVKDVLNERQMKVIQRMLKTGTKGFEGGMSAKKYMIITGTSKATATRDLQHLAAIHIFIQIGSGRSVRYELCLERCD